MTHTDTYTFKYNSDEDSIDLNTLLLSQIHFSTILNEIKNEIAGDTDLNIKIRPLTKGSVPFDFTLTVSWINSLFSPEVVGYASSIITIFGAVIGIRKWLKGGEAEVITISEDKVTIKRGDVEIIVDQASYRIATKNETVDKAIQKGFDAIEKDESVTGVQILNPKKELIFDVPREDFSSLTAPSEIFEEHTIREEPKIEFLSIFKVVFGKGYKWQFYYNGRKISATIEDNDFMERLDKGERFAKGDILEVELQVEKVLDKTLEVYIEKDFKVLKVIIIDPVPITTRGLFYFLKIPLSQLVYSYQNYLIKYFLSSPL
jgi:hypothetical protein